MKDTSIKWPNGHRQKVAMPDLTRGLLLSLLITACDREESWHGESNTVRLTYLSGLAQHPEEVLNEAAEILGMELVIYNMPDATKGAVYVTFTDDAEEGVAGSSSIVNQCAPAVWAGLSSATLAHELGHALGLEHVDDPNNLMWHNSATRKSVALTEDQVDLMLWSAWWMDYGCGLP